MKKYEYIIIYSVKEDLLNSYGKDGWEVAGVCSTTGSYFIILKREIRDKIKEL